MKHPFEKLTDAGLLQRYMEGDEAAFREIVHRYKNGLHAFLKQFLNQPDLVDDVFQETFLQLFASRKSFDPSRPLNEAILDQWDGWISRPEDAGVIIHLEF